MGTAARAASPPTRWQRCSSDGTVSAQTRARYRAPARRVLRFLPHTNSNWPWSTLACWSVDYQRQLVASS